MATRIFGIIVVGLTLLVDTSAWADRIDGTWCLDDGAHLSIDGPSITTPGGATITGDYRRHFFSFVVPPSEPGAGSAVGLVLLNENTMQERIGSAAPRTWVRCTPPVSLLLLRRRFGSASG